MIGVRTNRIHPTAVIGEQVELGCDNEIGPYAVIEGPVTIGDRNVISAGVWIGGPVRIGSDNYLAPKATIGAPAQWSTDDGVTIRERQPFGVEIGHRNVIREHVTIHQGSERPTVVGNSCTLMAYAHLGHDVRLADGVNLTVDVTLGGFVSIGAKAYLGLGTTVRQRAVIGPLAIVGMGSVVTRHVPPATVAFGSPAKVTGVNSTGFERQGVEVGPVDHDDLRQALAAVGAGSFDPTRIPAALHEHVQWYFSAVAAAGG